MSSSPKAESTIAGSTVQASAKRIAKMVSGLSEKAPPKLAPYIQMAAPAIGQMAMYVEMAIPYIVVAGKKAYAIYLVTPMDIFIAILGLVFCFAGGIYPALFAAIEAARHTGYDTTMAAVKDLTEEAIKIIEENKKDNLKDEDNDGTADVDQISGKELVLRKTQLVIVKCDPAKVNGALGGLYMSWIAVMAVLKVQFARVVTMALTISEQLEKPCEKYVTPAVATVVPAEYQKWIPICCGWLTKWIAITIAWWVQRILSAATTAMRGGLMTARHLMKYCREHGINPGGMIPENDEDTYIDEVVGWSLAGLGFMWQLTGGFSLPFPLNIMMWPFAFAESFIRWSITSSTVTL